MGCGVIVAGVRQGADQGPQMAALRQPRQMLADLNAGRPGSDRLELTPILGCRLRFQIEAVLLSKSARKKNVNTSSLVGFRFIPGKGTQSQHMFRAQAEQADGAGTKRRAPRDDGMLQGTMARMQQVSPFT